MQDYELLGAFYLGRQQAAGNDTEGELLLYDSRDLTTHAVIIGMTGSGKTGLGLGLIEEAGMDHVPVIAIDPKGDMGNLLLTFPDLAPGTAMRGTTRARQHSLEVGRAGETLADIEAQMEALEAELAAEVERQHLAFGAQMERLEEISVKPRASDIQVRTVALAWLPAGPAG